MTNEIILFFNKFLSEFSHLTIMILPYFCLGILFGALLESKANFNIIHKFLNKGKRSIVAASTLGGILPGCACATIPMAEGLLRKNARLATVVAFIFTSPLLAPQTIILTHGLLGAKFTIARVIFSMVGGISIGLIIHYIGLKKPTIIDSLHDHNNCSHHDEKPRFLNSVLSISKKLGKYFIIGMAISALLTISIPKDIIPNTLSQFPLLGYFVAALIGIPVYICEGEEIPITFSLLSLGLSQGPALTFLLGAVGTCIPTMLFAQKILGKKPVIFYCVFWAVFAPLSGFIFSFF